MTAPHAHDWRRHHTAVGRRAPTDDANPIAHTEFFVLVCDCGAATVFPALNFLLTTPQYRELVAFELALEGYTFTPILDDALIAQLRDAVRSGAGHECDEWRRHDGRCLLCGPEDPCR